MVSDSCIKVDGNIVCGKPVAQDSMQFSKELSEADDGFFVTCTVNSNGTQECKSKSPGKILSSDLARETDNSFFCPTSNDMDSARKTKFSNCVILDKTKMQPGYLNMSEIDTKYECFVKNHETVVPKLNSVYKCEVANNVVQNKVNNTPTLNSDSDDEFLYATPQKNAHRITENTNMIQENRDNINTNTKAIQKLIKNPVSRSGYGLM